MAPGSNRKRRNATKAQKHNESEADDTPSVVESNKVKIKSDNSKKGAKKRQNSPSPPSPLTSKSKKGKMSGTTVSSNDKDNDNNSSLVTSPSTEEKISVSKKSKIEPQRITDRDEIPKLWDGKSATEQNGSYTFKIISWNVAGLRGLLNNYPDALPSLVKRYNPDVICLQETKLQDIHVTDPKLKIQGHLLHQEGYNSKYNCSVKKGYSGTAVFWKRWDSCVDHSQNTNTAKKKQANINNFFKKSAKDLSLDKKNETNDFGSSSSLEDVKNCIGDVPIEYLVPTEVQAGLGIADHDQEGRVLTMDYPLFSLSNVYVPNSGQDLQRLTYRTDSWDPALLSFMKGKKSERGVPCIWLGDLNVAHKNLDCWNDGAKHLLKSAGTTPQERASFQRQLDDDNGAFFDAFRYLHPNAKGWYTYWSQRAGNREPNKGLRLDYFVCSREMMEQSSKSKVIVRDCYMVDQLGSDHAPIVLELEIKR